MMSRIRSQLLLLVALLAVITCTSSDSTDPPPDGGLPDGGPPSVATRVGNTRGSAVVLSRDERVAVVCNRSASVVTVFALDPKAPADKVILTEQKREIALGPGWEPWAAVIGADDDTAYVISRRRQVVFRIVALHGNATRDDSLNDVAVGSEPTGIAISPSGARVFVANFGEGTISVITTYDFKARPSLDLNAALAGTGALGHVQGRPALAHPRALAVTDDGDADDSDETLYATEFFSQPRLGPPIVPTPGEVCRDRLKNSVPSCEKDCLCETCTSVATLCADEVRCRCALANPDLCLSSSRAPSPPFEAGPRCPCDPAEAFSDPEQVSNCMNRCVSTCSGDGSTDGGDDAADALPPTSSDGGADASSGAPIPPPPMIAGGVNVFDRNRIGLVYPIPLAAGAVSAPIFLQPILDTGFLDTPNRTGMVPIPVPTSCFPNQLYAAGIDHAGYLFVTGMCASPAGPINAVKLKDDTTDVSNFKTVVHPVVLVIDTKTNTVVASSVLTKMLDATYEADRQQGFPPNRRFPLIPSDLAFFPRPDEPSTSRDPKDPQDSLIYVTALGADAVFEFLDIESPTHAPEAPYFELRVGGPLGAPFGGTPETRFVDLHPKSLRGGQLPVGIALSRRTLAPFGLVVNDASQNLSVIDLVTSKVVAVEWTSEQVKYATDYRDSPANNGRRLFATGLGSWSLKGEAWLSCEGCHPDGLSDGVTWYFLRGPRRTISTAGTYDSAGNRRIMLWAGNIDEVHDIEAIVRTVAGGTGVVLKDYPLGTPTNDLRIVYDGNPIPKGEKSDPKPSSRLLHNLNGSLASIVTGKLCPPEEPYCDTSVVTDWNDVDAYLRTVRAPRAPTYLDPNLVEAGEKIFVAGRCVGCHGGPNFTLSKVFYPPGPANNGALPYFRPASPDFAASLPSLVGKLRTVTYDVPSAFQALNPPGKSGSATLRRWSPGADPVAYAYDPAMAPSDQINCVLRDVGTYPPQAAGMNYIGIVPSGAPQILEVRQDMKTLALGETGFNIPSLVGLSLGAPYFHAGNARTLEEVFDEAFQKHHQSIDPKFLASSTDRASAINALVAYLLSIDDGKPPPTDSTNESREIMSLGDLCSHHASPIE